MDTNDSQKSAIQADSDKRLAVLKGLVEAVEKRGLLLTDLSVRFGVESDSSMSRDDFAGEFGESWMTERQWRRGFTLSFGGDV